MLTRILEWYLSLFGLSLEPPIGSNRHLRNWIIDNPEKDLTQYPFFQ